MSEHLLKKKSELIQSLDEESRRKLFKYSSFDSIFHMRKFEISKNMSKLRVKPTPVPKPTSVPEPVPEPVPQPVPEPVPQPVPEIVMDEPTEGLLLEIGDSDGGIYIESDSDGLVVHMGSGTAPAHTVRIDENGDEYTIQHGTDKAIEVRVSKKAFKKYLDDSSLMIELYPQTTDDINIGGMRIWFSGVLVASYQHDFVTERLHSALSAGGFRSINNTIVTNKQVKSWKNMEPNQCKIFYQKNGRFINQFVLSNVKLFGKTYKNLGNSSKKIIDYLSSNISNDYKETLTTNTPQYISNKSQYDSHTMLIFFPSINFE